MTRTLGSNFSKLLSCLAVCATVGVTTEARADEADAKHDEGTALTKQGQFEGARVKLLQALALRPMAKTMLNLCVIEQQLKLEHEAIKHCRQFIDAKDADQAMVKTVQDGIMHELEQSTGRVTIVSEPGQKVEIDGRGVGTAPFSQPIDLKPGEHSCTSGGRTIKVVIKGGDNVTVKLTFGASDTPPGETKRGSWLAPGILGGVGVVGVGVGVGLALAASGKATTLNDARTTRNCAGPTDPNCQDLSDALSGGKGLRTGSFIAYGVGGAALVGAIVATAIIAPWKERPAADSPSNETVVKSARLVPVIEPGRAEFLLTGRF